jgi:TP901 family phage tail tape measure protein
MASGDFLARIKLALEGKEKVVSGLAETERAAQKLTKTRITTIFDKEGLQTGKQVEETFKDVGTAAGKSLQQMGDFEKSLRRAAIVAPVWMALRFAMTSVMSTISEGFRVWEDFDRALIKSKDVIHGYAGTTEEAMIKLEGTIRNFSKESGISLDQLASSFYRFGTVGIAFEESLTGAIASAKLAKATLGDTDTIARSLAMGFRLLGKTVDSSLSPMQKQESIAGKILSLWRTEAFEANEFAGSLSNFVSTANIANFTMDETIALLSSLGTAGVQGSRGGTLLKTSIQKLVENLDKLAPTLGLAVNPELENTFSLFMRVLEAINKLSQTKGIPKEALKAINEIFGGVRGGQAISALNSLLPELKKNLENLGRDPQEFIKGLNDRFKEVTDTVSGQLDILKRYREAVGEAFVQGVFGGKNFKDSLVSVNMAMEGMIGVSNKIGDFFRFVGNPLKFIKDELKDINQTEDEFVQRVEDAEAGLLSVSDTVATMDLIAEHWGKNAFTDDLINRIKKTAIELRQNEELYGRLDKIVNDFNKNSIQAENVKIEKTKQLSLELQDRLGTMQDELALLKLDKAGASDLTIAHMKLNGLVETLVERYNNLKDASGNVVTQISKSQVIAAVLSGDFEKLLNIFQEMNLSEKEINALMKNYSEINKVVLADFQKQLGLHSDISKFMGEEESAIIEQEMALKALVYGEEYLKNNTEDRLKLAKAINQEMDEQEKSSSRIVELFKITKKYGEGVAQEVSKFLGGAVQFKQLSGMAQQALRRTLSGEFEKGTAEEFFRNQPGFQFPEQVEKERKAERNLAILSSVGIEPITLNVSLNSDEIIDKTKEAISAALDDKKSELSQKIHQQIEDF